MCRITESWKTFSHLHTSINFFSSFAWLYTSTCKYKTTSIDQYTNFYIVFFMFFSFSLIDSWFNLKTHSNNLRHFKVISFSANGYKNYNAFDFIVPFCSTFVKFIIICCSMYATDYSLKAFKYFFTFSFSKNVFTKDYTVFVNGEMLHKL